MRFGIHALPKNWLQDLVSWNYRFSEVRAALPLEVVKQRASPQGPEFPFLFCSHRAGGQFVPIWKWRVRSEPYEAPDFRASHLSLENNNWRGSNCHSGHLLLGLGYASEDEFREKFFKNIFY